MYRIVQTYIVLVIASMCIVSCNDMSDNASQNVDNFDRKTMLSDWSDNIIIPAYERYSISLEVLSVQYENFKNEPSIDKLTLLRNAYIDAYKLWQWVSMYEIGKAESNNIRNFTNIFPCDTSSINKHIESQSYNLDLPSNYDTQGFPAIDYLLYGIAEDDTKIIQLLTNTKYETYFNNLIARLLTLCNEIKDDWKTDYYEIFINNSGSSATSSVDKLVNDFLLYFEKFLRAGKIGIPAGIFSGNTISSNIEAPYSGIYSKELFLEAMKAVQYFIEGKTYDGADTVTSIKQYLQYIRTQNNTTDIAFSIENQLQQCINAAEILSSNLKTQVETDNTKMLQVYDELQKTVILLKVDMMQALNIQIDYVDADGD